MDARTQKLLDELIGGWLEWDTCGDYYLKVLTPKIVRFDERAQLDDRERKIVEELHGTISPTEWQRLPELIRERREKPKRETAPFDYLTEHNKSKPVTPDHILKADSDRSISDLEREKLRKANFVQEWAKHELGYDLDPEQAAAVAAGDGDVQVIARAGSGKTRTLITRALFLQKHCNVSPNELLLLAFNRKAAEDMKRRLAKVLGVQIPHVMTFHALAHALVHPEENIVFDDGDAGQFGLSHEVHEVVDEHLTSPKYLHLIRDLMLAHFREDWERIEAGGFHLIMDEFLAYRRALPHVSLKNDYVKSFGEKVIANALFENSVEYKYERNFRWDGINYRPDFTILTEPKRGVIIEYFGLKGDPDYDAMSEEKRAFWAKRKEWTFLEIYPKDLVENGIDSFVLNLLEKVKQAGVSCRRRSDEEIWELIKERALDGFTESMQIFIGRCRKKNLTPENLQYMVAGHTPCSAAECLFLEVGVSVYKGYLERLNDNKKEDFDGLMWRAVSEVRDGKTIFVRDRGRERGDVALLRYVLIDEFQDFSEMFFELVKAIRSKNPDVQFFCVGDDWQAINAFAGSDLCYFDDFAINFKKTTRLTIPTNYRSPKSIVEVGNALMNGRGLRAVPQRSECGLVQVGKLDNFQPVALEMEKHNGDEITPALLRMLGSYLDRDLNVVLLSRCNSIPWYVNYNGGETSGRDGLQRFLDHIRSFFPREAQDRITASTVHRYKGLEQSAVIVLDAVRRCYPLIHPNWVFLRVFGDNIAEIENEERRLFYVAITRAKDSLAFLTETFGKTPYLDDINRQVRPDTIAWDDLPPIQSQDYARVEIRVFNAYDVKDQLKEQKYRWNGQGRYWCKTINEEEFSFANLLEQPWARNSVEIEVYSEAGALLHRQLPIF